MAKATTTPVKMKANNINTKWIKNAMKSIGISTQDALKDIYPNLAEVTSSGVSASKNILTSIKQNSGGAENLANSLKNNKYVKYASKAYSNALADLKSGNFNNTDRFMGGDEGFDQMFAGLDDSSSSDISFGDEDTGATNNVSFNYVNKGNNDAVLAFQEQSQKQSEAFIKTNKASMDAQIAVASASMYQIEKLGSEIISHLGNISNNLTALVNYNNENMTRFIEASLSYYEMIGKKQEEQTKSSRIDASDVFNNKQGGININQYKNYVKQQLKDSLRGSPLGMLEMLTDDSILEMAVSNPLGFASKGIISYMIPKLVGTTIDSVEKTFSTFVPTMLNRLADWGDEYTGGMLGNLKRTIGKTFGLRVNVKKNKRIEAAKVNKGPIPFDGETKHAITEIITKELREQTSYLEAIARHFRINTEKARGNADVWDYDRGQYIKVRDIQSSIANTIQESFLNTFKSGEFGKAMQSLVYSQEGDKAQKSLEHTLDQFLTLAGRASSSINLSDKSNGSEYRKILDELRKNRRERRNVHVLEQYIEDLIKNDPNTANDFARSLLTAQSQRITQLSDINANPTDYNLFASGLNGANVDRLIDRELGYFKYSKNRSRGKKVTVEPVNRGENTGLFGQMLSNFGGHMIGQMNKAMSGDYNGANGELVGLVKDQSKLIIDKMSTTILRPFRDAIVGTGKEGEETVLSNLKSMGREIKEGVLTKFLGEKNADGKREGHGIISKIGNIFTEGMIGWKEAFLGKPMEEEEKKKFTTSLREKFKDRLPSTLTGGIVGGGLGASFGGILGNLIGGPFAGAILGSATGFLSKSEKFQEMLFGKKDEEGNRLGGLISKKIQDFVKEHKARLVGGASVGGITGALGITGNGLLGTLVGGPLAGAITGMAGSIFLKSNMFTDFLFGSSKDGQKGLFKGITDAFKEHAKIAGGDSETTIDGKRAGMTAIGVGGGALAGALLTKFGILGAALGPIGPIGGALAGLGLSIKASGKNFREWLFGRDEEDINGNKVHRQGVVGQFGNMLNTSVFRPILHEAQYIFKDIALSVKTEALLPFSFLAEKVAGVAGDIYSKFRGVVTEGFNAMGELVEDKVIKHIGAVLAPFTDTINKAAEVAAFAAKNVALLPFRLLRKGMEAMNTRLQYVLKPFKFLIDETKNIILGGVNKVVDYAIGGLKGVFGLMAAPFKFVGGLVSTGVNKAYNYVQNKKSERRAKEGPIDWGTKEGTLSERIERARINRKREREQLKEERRQWKIHDKNARLIAKYTNNQFGADTTEGREALRRSHPSAYRRLNLNIDTEDAEKEKTRIAKEGHGTVGLSSDQLSRADVDKLSEEGKQTFYLHELYKAVVRGEKPKDVVDKQKKKEQDQKKADKKEEENEQDQNEDAVMEDEFVPQNASFREYFKSVGRDIMSFFFGSDEVDAVTGKVTGRSSSILDRAKDGVVDEAKSYGRAFKGFGSRFMNMTREMRDFHRGRKNNRNIMKYGPQPQQEEEPQENTGGEGRGFRRFRRGGFGLASLAIPKSVDAIPVVVKDFEGNAEDKLSESIEDQTKATLADRKSDARLNLAKERGESADERKARLEKEEQKEREEDIRKNTKVTADATVENGSSWRSIFGKKGLITGGLIILAPLLIKLMKWLITGPGKILGGLLIDGLGGLVKLLKGIGGNLKDIITGAISGFLGDAERTNKNKDRENGKSASEEIKEEVDNTKQAVSELAEGNFLGAWNTFVTDKDGEVNHATFAKNKFLASQLYNNNKVRKGAKAVATTVKQGGKLVKKGATSLSNKRILAKQVGKKGAKALAKQYGGYAEAVAAYGDGGVTIAEKAKTKVASLSDDAVKKVQSVAIKAKSSNNKIVTTVISYVDNFIKFITEKVIGNFGVKISQSAFGTAVSAVKKVIQNQANKIATRAAKILGSNTVLAATTAGVGWVVKEGLFVTIGVLDGLTGAARLFQVDSKYVDGTMRTISTIIGGLKGTTTGSIIDMVNEIVAEVTGNDFISNIACNVYMKIAGEEKSSKLEKGRSEFYDEYIDYKTSKIEKAYNNALKDGTIDATMTLDQYKEAVANGSIEVEYDSFTDYNHSKHKSLVAKVTDVATSAASTVRKGFNKVVDTFTNSGKSSKKDKSAYLDTSKINNKVTSEQLKNIASQNFGPVQRKEVVKKDPQSSNYVDTSKIKNTVTSAELKEISNQNFGPVQRSKNSIGLEKIVKANMSTTTVYVNDVDGSYYKGDGTHYTASGTKLEQISTSELMELIISNQVHEATMSTDPASIQTAYNTTVGEFVRKTQSNLENLKNTWAKGSKVKEKAITFVSDGIGAMNNFVENFLSGNDSKVKKVFGTKSTTVYMDVNGNYYKPNGSGFNYCNANGDIIRTGVTAEEVQKQIELGVVTGTKEIKNSAAQQAVSKIQSAVKGAWDKAKDIVSSGWDKLTGWLSDLGRNGKQSNYVNIGGSTTSDYTPQTGTAVNNTTTIDAVTGGNGRGFRRMLRGGRGDETVNGFSYYSQSDPRWKDNAYNVGNDNATMDTTGCGPTAFSMIASQMTGRNVDPTETATLAKVTGNRDNTGTNWNFINQAAGAYGISSQETENPSAQYISDQLDQGKPMILSGASGGGYGGGFGVKSNSAYTPAGHYVVAVGKDNDGNVLINDPRGKQYSGKYNLNDVASETGAAWSFDNGGYGKGKGTKATRRYFRRGGFGKKDNTSSGSNMFTATDVIAVALSEVGYEEKKSNSNLYDKHANAGSANYTKYNKDCFGVGSQYWCAAFVCWCFWTAAGKNKTKASKVLGGWSAACNSLVSSFKKMNRFDKNPQPGDCIFFSGTRHSGANHIGIVYKVTNGKVYTIEGNTSSKEFDDNGGCVAKKEYDRGNSRILGYGHPRYDAMSSFNRTYTISDDDSAGVQGVGSDYPKYTDLSKAQKERIATLITGETGGEDEVAARQEASQIANLNESKGRSKNAEGIMKTVNSSWYSPNSFTRGKTKTAEQAVEDVIVKGHRTFPRYVVEHDTFPNDILNAKDRSEYKMGDDVANVWKSKYQFYTFMGKDKKGDIAGYFKDLYKKYKDDVPWGDSAVGSDLTAGSTTTDGTTPTETTTTESKSLFDAISDYVSATANAAIGGILTGNYDTSEMQKAWEGATINGSSSTGTTGTITTATGDDGSIESTGVSTNNIPKKEKETGDKKYPKTIMVNGTTYKIPQQKEFGSFSQKHGCSLAAGTMGIQKAGNVLKSPDDIYNWANKNLPNKGAKLGIYGTMKAINAMSGNEDAAKWYPITSKNKEKAINNIDTAIDNGSFVLLEQGNPIHTTTFIGRKKNGKLAEVTYGDYKDKWNHSTSWEVKQKAITGSGKESEQTDWWHGSKSSAGYVVVNGANNTATNAATTNNQENATVAKNNNKNNSKKGGNGGGFGTGRPKPVITKNGFTRTIHSINSGGYGDGNVKNNRVVTKYVNNTSSSDKAIEAVIQLLSQIANNTLTTSQKLELLENLSGETVTNVYTGGGNGQGVVKQTTKKSSSTPKNKSNPNKNRSSNSNGNNRNQALAYKIAAGV